MNPDTREFLDHLACVAQANVDYLFDQEREGLTLDDQGAEVLMQAYLELYHQYMGNSERLSAPSRHAYSAAEACCAMRRQLEQRPRAVWSGDEEGLFTLMLGFMFMFKHLYVVRG